LAAAFAAANSFLGIWVIAQGVRIASVAQLLAHNAAQNDWQIGSTAGPKKDEEKDEEKACIDTRFAYSVHRFERNVI
jgi:hypothetical protein